MYEELHQAVASIDEQEDLRWWRNTHGPGMPTDWPHFQVTPNHTAVVVVAWWAEFNSSKILSFYFILFVCRCRRPSEGMDATTEEEQEGEEGGGGEDGHDREEVGGAAEDRRDLIGCLFKLTSCFASSSVMIGGVRVRALYDYVGQETDELSFKAGKPPSSTSCPASSTSCPASAEFLPPIFL